ncbi:asparagine synthase-related protein [Leptolyngbya sp. CCNP1308]|uniref:asparagine synthetase B family protein n=1 Tax=Leptolyngbya sp. CCNP1308 TaxID=3110255 RepID=UPI002B20E11C|nr:asparagine synthase-related protein [Leptolyngbya sp. CCNP1308]MEA5449494.1 asparagine synthase-related protein [Leptolyngbya sp. CCNP1308]
MLRFPRQPIRYPLPVAPTWCLGWGPGANLKGAAWQEGPLAIALNPGRSVESQLVLSPSGRYVVVGDVWLRERRSLLTDLALENSLHQSDMQLVAVAWERWQGETLTKLVGSFCLAVWDREQQVLELGRDPAGARTLYYTAQGATRWAAGDLRSLAPYRSNALDPIALRDYLCCAFVPGDRTLWQDVRELRPGTRISWPGDDCQAYWHLEERLEAEGNGESLEWHGERLRSHLNQVVQDSLPDAPVGVFLSGGLDSSAITALAAKYHHDPVHTYSIHFGDPYPNELEFSSLVAQHCGTQHHILEIPLAQMWEQLPEAMAWLDDPIGDPLTVPNLLLGQLARQQVAVVLNGEGGDPCFGGPKNQPMLINQLYGSISPQDPLQAYLLAFRKCAADLPQLLKPDLWAAVQHEPYCFAEDLHSSASYLNRLMALNIKFKGADQILTKVNNLTRAAGVEGRSPLFDQRIVELSMTIPPQYKLSGVEEKAVLKQAVSDLLPEAIFKRPKSGMMVPVQAGFQREWQRAARELLLSRRAAIAPYLNQTLIQQWLNYQGDPWRRYGVKLWLLVSLEIWLQVNQNCQRRK